MNFPELNATIGMSDPTPGKPSGAKAHQNVFFLEPKYETHSHDGSMGRTVYLPPRINEWLILVWQIIR